MTYIKILESPKLSNFHRLSPINSKYIFYIHISILIYIIINIKYIL